MNICLWVCTRYVRATHTVNLCAKKPDFYLNVEHEAIKWPLKYIWWCEAAKKTKQKNRADEKWEREKKNVQSTKQNAIEGAKYISAYKS